MSLHSVNPATGETIASFEEHTPAEIEGSLERAIAAFNTWRREPLTSRTALLRNVAGALRDRRDSLAAQMTVEMGKVVTEARAEVDKCVWACEHYADHALQLLSDRPVESAASRSYVSYQPLGPILGVMPWNFPFWQVLRYVAPTLVAGNVALLKHASNVSGCALALEEVFRDAGAPEGVFQVLLVRGSSIGSVLADPRVAAATLTGSTPAGKAVAEVAGRHLKKVVLELGGSDPYVVLEDADLEPTIDSCATARMINAGQSCIAGKRFVVHGALLESFTDALVQKLAEFELGDPALDSTQLGPLARHDLRQELHDQVARSIDAGARCLLGGQIPPGPGCFYPPTVLTDVRAGMPAYDEELFGPVAAVIPADSDEDALRIANDTPFGLGAAVFSSDSDRAERMARDHLDAGNCFVNDFVRSDPRLPFGGVKESGYGRELGAYGIYEFVNIKTVWVA